MKSYLLSIKPKWCELIASGKKTIEVRKTAPKSETPFKCYIYCTKPKERFRMSSVLYSFKDYLIRNENGGSISIGDGMNFWANEAPHTYLNGKVIGEFVCDRMFDFVQAGAGIMFAQGDNQLDPKIALRLSCLSEKEIDDYLGGKDGYGWHISALKIYDEPKDLSEFGLKHAPQSWCRVAVAEGARNNEQCKNRAQRYHISLFEFQTRRNTGNR